MTNEEKAKRYDEAIKKLRDLHDNYDEISNLVNFKQEIEEIFPELKENEDERIRKEIIHYILYKADGVSEEQEHSWITYLEKQKEHQNKSDAREKALGRDLTFPQDKDKNLDEIAQDYVDGVKEYNPEPTWDLMQTAVCYGYHYREQKEQKPMYNLEIPAEDVTPVEEDGPFDEDEFLENELSAFLQNYDKEYDDDATVSDVAKHFYEIGKKQKEQIPYTDFVIKPHKGDENNPYDMSVSEAQDYAIKRGLDISFNDGEVFIDERYITQTVGNILRWADEHPKEEKSTNELEDAFKYYTDRGITISCGDFKAEPKKEQKSVKYLNKDMVYAIMNKLHKLAFSQLIPINSDEYKKIDEITSDVSKLLDYPIEQKPAEWSEEDEKMRNALWNLLKIQYAQDYSMTGVGIEAGKFRDWLKSLRPQPHTVSIKDATKFGNLEYERGVKDGIQSEKSHQWKPSEEQMAMLLAVINEPNNAGAESCRLALKSLYEQLKKLM